LARVETANLSGFEPPCGRERLCQVRKITEDPSKGCRGAASGVASISSTFATLAVRRSQNRRRVAHLSEAETREYFSRGPLNSSEIKAYSELYFTAQGSRNRPERESRSLEGGRDRLVISPSHRIHRRGPLPGLPPPRKVQKVNTRACVALTVQVIESADLRRFSRGRHPDCSR
jgi:hypothetical protein